MIKYLNEIKIEIVKTIVILAITNNTELVVSAQLESIRIT